MACTTRTAQHIQHTRVNTPHTMPPPDVSPCVGLLCSFARPHSASLPFVQSLGYFSSLGTVCPTPCPPASSSVL